MDNNTSSRTLNLQRDEVSFRRTTSLAALKLFLDYEYHWEAALGGSGAAQRYIHKTFPRWPAVPFYAVPQHLVNTQVDAIERAQFLAAASRLLPSPSQIPDNVRDRYQHALNNGRALVPLPAYVSDEALEKVDGLTREKYQQLITEQKAGPIELAPQLIDWSLADETMIEAFRAFLTTHRLITPIHQERGKSSTMSQLRIIQKALVVFRLLRRAKLSIPKAVEQMNDWGLKSPYAEEKQQHWKQAAETAEMLLEQAKKGKFVQAVENFVLTSQFRKLIIPSEIRMPQ